MIFSSLRSKKCLKIYTDRYNKLKGGKMQKYGYPTADIIYCYDGTFDGFLSCVFESFNAKHTPFAIWRPSLEKPSLYQSVFIETNELHAKRVFDSIGTKICKDAQELISVCFLSGNEEKEFHLLRFIQFALAEGKPAMYMLGHEKVAPVYAMQKNVLHEAHLFKGFVRFEESNGMLGAVIAPKNYVLPILRLHFCARFYEENFLIYDETHCAALLHNERKTSILDLVAPLKLPTPDEKESYYQSLWKQFYNTIEIKPRHNEKCRRTHCPKRYWAHMTELKEHL